MANAKTSNDRFSRADSAGCTIIAFPKHSKNNITPSVYYFSMRDRMHVLEWANSRLQNNQVKFKFQPAVNLEDQDSSEFLLIYCDTSGWATWGINCVEGGYSLWHSARGTTVGTFATLREVLQKIDTFHFN